MLNEYIADEDNTTRTNYAFNPTCTECDEHVGNRIGISAVFGERFIKERTSSCDHHYDQSVERHKRYLDPNDVGLYQALTAKMKNSVTVEEYDTAKSRLANLIKQRLKLNQKPLEDTLRFWDMVNYRWATAFKSNLHGIPRSSLAEAAQASMKAANEKNLSLVDAVYADISDSARFDATWKNRLQGEISRCRGPSGIDLEERGERRQIDRANRYIRETCDDVQDMNVLLTSAGKQVLLDVPVTESNNMPKLKKRRSRSIDSTCVQIMLRRMVELDAQTRIVEMNSNEEEVRVYFIKETVIFTC